MLLSKPINSFYSVFGHTQLKSFPAQVIMIDAYDVLGVNIDADIQVIKKAYRRLSLQHHPDKVQASRVPRGEGDKFTEIKAAYDILQDPYRRRVYDAFGVDLGVEPPEQEVWSIGVSHLAVPMSAFTMKTLVAYFARWLVRSQLLKLGVSLCCMIAFVIHAKGIRVSFGSLCIHRIEPVLVSLGAMGGLVVVHSVWPLAFDGACLFYLVSEVAGTERLVQSKKVCGGVAIGCVAVAWLVRRWWIWIVAFEVALSGLALLACGLVAGVLRLYIEGIEARHGQRVKERREMLRRERKRLADEAAGLKERLERG